MSTPRREATIIDPRGRRKVYRPLPPEARDAALRAGLHAYDRGEFFEAHEILEPAWMGTDDSAERDLYQGLIKLAAAYVHAVRGNPTGWAKNLRGSRERLARAVGAGERLGIDTGAIVRAIDAALAADAGIGAGEVPIPVTRRGAATRPSGGGALPSA